MALVVLTPKVRLLFLSGVSQSQVCGVLLCRQIEEYFLPRMLQDLTKQVSLMCEVHCSFSVTHCHASYRWAGQAGTLKSQKVLWLAYIRSKEGRDFYSEGRSWMLLLPPGPASPLLTSLFLLASSWLSVPPFFHMTGNGPLHIFYTENKMSYLHGESARRGLWCPPLGCIL